MYVRFHINSQQKDSNFIPQTDREQIKAIIVNLMLSVSRKVQQQLSAALELISEQDFPAEWQNLLPVCSFFACIYVFKGTREQIPNTRLCNH